MPDVEVLLVKKRDGVTEARVDDTTISVNDTKPKTLTDEQYKRLKDAGVRNLKKVEEGEDEFDALKGEALDAALEERGLLEGNKSKSAEDKRDLLRDHDDEEGSD